jgi:hypothetical protein
MRPLRKCGLLVAVLVLVAPACGSSPPQRTVKTAAATGPPSLGRWWHFSPTTTTAPAPPAPVVPSTVPSPRRRAVSPARPATGGGTGWEALRQCENGGSYAGTSNGYYGAYQFDRGTWASNNVAGGEWGTATPAQQDAAAQHLYAQRGAQPWPVCGRHLHG